MKNPERIRVGDRVTIYRRGKSGIWCADFWFDDEHRRTSLKTQNKKIAIQRAVKLDNDLIDGSFSTSATNRLIVDAINDYLAYLQNENRARKTIARYRGELNGFCEFCLGLRARRLTQITPTLFDRYRAGLKTRHKPRTVYHESVVVKQFLRWSISRRSIAADPLADYKLQKPVSEPKPAPSLPEVWQFLDAAKEPLRARLAVLAFTGMRSGELQRLRTEDVDLSGNWIHIVSREGAETKTRYSRSVPIHSVLVPFLRRQTKPTGSWFFSAEPSAKYPRGDHWINPKKRNERFQGCVSRLGMPVGRNNDGYVIHSFRHFFERVCVNAGIPQRVIDTW